MLLMETNRIIWIDWMKAIGMYFIILGHFFSIGHLYIYVFNVPLFFLISGFLSKHEDDITIFWKKIWYNLVIPLLLISVIDYIYYALPILNHPHYNIKNICYFPINLLLGNFSAVKTCWFVYTLIVIKIINQFTNRNPIKLSLFCLFLLLAYFINKYNFQKDLGIGSNSIINVLLAYPFFIIGDISKKYIKNINCIANNNKLLFVIFLVSCSLIYICGRVNGIVYMYKCSFGHNIILFLIGGLAGTSAIFVLSNIIKKSPKYLNTIAIGSIIILGFHLRMITLVFKYVEHRTIFDFILAFLILLLFIPIILFVKKYLPVLIGKYRVLRK